MPDSKRITLSTIAVYRTLANLSVFGWAVLNTLALTITFECLNSLLLQATTLWQKNESTSWAFYHYNKGLLFKEI